MPDIDVALRDGLLEWEARLAEGDHSRDAWAVAALVEGARTTARPKVAAWVREHLDV